MAARTASAYTTTLLALIVVVLMSLVFGGLTYYFYEDGLQYRAYDPNRQESKVQETDTLLYKNTEIRDLEKDIAPLREDKDDLLFLRNDIDMKLAARDHLYDTTDETWLGLGDSKTRYQQMVDSVNHTLTVLKSQHKELDDSKNSIFVPLEELIDSLQREAQKVQQDIIDMDAKLEEDKDALHAKLENLEKEQEAHKKVFGDKFSTLSTKISQANDEIRRLLELELKWHQETKPDGRILSTTETRKYCIVNIGKVDRVFNGLPLEIFQYVKGRFIHKGWAEVINTEAQVATCRVVHEADPRRHPISSDDMVGNPVFSTKRPLVFVLAGEFRRFNRGDLENFIRRTGAEVRPRLEPGVDFLIAGERSEAEQDKAREYHILAMNEDKLIKYLYKTFEYKNHDPVASAD